MRASKEMGTLGVCNLYSYKLLEIVTNISGQKDIPGFIKFRLNYKGFITDSLYITDNILSEVEIHCNNTSNKKLFKQYYTVIRALIEDYYIFLLTFSSFYTLTKADYENKTSEELEDLELFYAEALDDELSAASRLLEEELITILNLNLNSKSDSDFINEIMDGFNNHILEQIVNIDMELFMPLIQYMTDNGTIDDIIKTLPLKMTSIKNTTYIDIVILLRDAL